MDGFVLNNTADPSPYVGAPPCNDAFGSVDAKLSLLPPGAIDVKMRLAHPTFDVNINQCLHRMSINSDRVTEAVIGPETLGFFQKGSEIRVATTNLLPGCIVEISDRALTSWTDDSNTMNPPAKVDRAYRGDRVAAHLGRAAIRFLRSVPNNADKDRMTLEALALGISARAFALFTAGDEDADAEQNAWKRRGDWRRIRLAVEWAESYLVEPRLSISDMANAAGLSSCYFGVVFKDHLGETPYAYVLRRRAEFARDLIEGTDEPIAEVAVSSGFSSQAHMTKIMHRVLGVTPGRLRSRR